VVNRVVKVVCWRVDFRVGVFCSFLKFIFGQLRGLKQAKSGMVGDYLDCNGIAWDDCGCSALEGVVIQRIAAR
jgi:hypothetical protein